MAFRTLLLLLQVVVLGCMLALATNNLNWSSATPEMIALPHEATFLEPRVLLLIRLVFLCVILCSTGYIYLDPSGLQVTVIGADGSRRLVLLKHFERLAMFTVWSWILQGLYFACAIYTGMLHICSPFGHPVVNELVPKIAWVLYEISLPVAFMVSLVVTYVLIPGLKNDDMPTNLFFQPMALMMHNANVFFMASEFVLNRVAITFAHYPFVLLYASAYVAFAWIWHAYTGMFYYFFLDYNRKGAVLWYIGLLAMIFLLYSTAYWCSYFRFESNFIIPSLTIIFIKLMSLKITDDSTVPVSVNSSGGAVSVGTQ